MRPPAVHTATTIITAAILRPRHGTWERRRQQRRRTAINSPATVAAVVRATHPPACAALMSVPPRPRPSRLRGHEARRRRGGRAVVPGEPRRPPWEPRRRVLPEQRLRRSASLRMKMLWPWLRCRHRRVVVMRGAPQVITTTTTTTTTTRVVAGAGSPTLRWREGILPPAGGWRKELWRGFPPVVVRFR
eukprot:1417230-Pyramimonas_sp.AAC.1